MTLLSSRIQKLIQLQLIVIAVSILVQYVWHTGVPFWGIFLTFALAAVYVIPVGTVYAVANLNSNVLTVLGEIISGYLLQGKPLVMLIFKVSGTKSMRGSTLIGSSSMHILDLAKR